MKAMYRSVCALRRPSCARYRRVASRGAGQQTLSPVPSQSPDPATRDAPRTLGSSRGTSRIHTQAAPGVAPHDAQPPPGRGASAEPMRTSLSLSLAREGRTVDHVRMGPATCFVRVARES